MHTFSSKSLRLSSTEPRLGSLALLLLRR